jgi:hypothetical protein
MRGIKVCPVGSNGYGHVQNFDKNLIDSLILLLSDRMIFFMRKQVHFFARPGHGDGQRGKA